MSGPIRSHSDSSQHLDPLRKRVGKACDRCRLKKSKCDGSSPCSRCRADNTICVFGERKKSPEKPHPKGYVEMLEQQQTQLVAGLQEAYRLLATSGQWPGKPLEEHEGHPLIHDMLTALDIIHPKSDATDDNVFEENPELLRQRLIAHGAPLLRRRNSNSSDSDHSVHSNKRSFDESMNTAAAPRSKSLHTSFDYDSVTSSPMVESPISLSAKPRQHQHKPSRLNTASPSLVEPTQPLDDDVFGPWTWQNLIPDDQQPQQPQFTFPQPNDNTKSFGSWPSMGPQGEMDPTFMDSYPTGFTSNFVNFGNLPQKDNFDFDLSGFMPMMPITT